MATTIPCPNPICTHQFGLAELQSAAQLLCPKCGFKMQGRAAAPPKPAAPPAKPAPKPAAKPAAPKLAVAQPMAAKSAPAQVKAATPIAAGPVPASAPVEVATGPPPAAALPSGEESLSDGTFFNPEVGAATGALVRTGTSKKKFNWMRLLITLFAVGFAVCIVIVAITGIFWFFLGSDGLRGMMQTDGGYIGNLRNAKNENEKVYRLVLPKGEWGYDGELTSRFNPDKERQAVVSAWKSNDYDFWFVLVAKDYGMHKPRDAEMLRIAIDKLEAYFTDGLELGAKAEPMKFGSLSAQKLQFRGEAKSVRWLGECYLFFNNGIAYWLIAASPDENVIDYFATALPEKHVFLLSDRKGWREQPLPTEAFASVDSKIDMTALKGVWEEGDPKAEDTTCKLLLGGKYLRAKDNRKNARLLIFALEKKDDLKAAITAARDHLAAREKESNEKAKVVHASDVVPGQSELGSLEDVGNKRGRMVDLKLMLAEEPEPHRYYLLSVINDPTVCYVIVCECSWASRQIWRQDFQDVLRTMRVK